MGCVSQLAASRNRRTVARGQQVPTLARPSSSSTYRLCNCQDPARELTSQKYMPQDDRVARLPQTDRDASNKRRARETIRSVWRHAASESRPALPVTTEHTKGRPGRYSSTRSLSPTPAHLSRLLPSPVPAQDAYGHWVRRRNVTSQGPTSEGARMATACT